MKYNHPLLSAVIEGIQEKKGKNITVVDLRKTSGAIADYFVICQGNSPTQVDAIADSVEDTLRDRMDERPVKVIGRELSQWVAMDYSDILVHIFLPEACEFYDLEHLWEDAAVFKVEDVD